MEIELQEEIEVSTNLWIPLESSHQKPWCTSFVRAQEGPPFYAAMKRGRLGHGSKRVVIGHFQKQGWW